MKNILLLSAFFIVSRFLPGQILIPEIKDKNSIVKISQLTPGIVDLIYIAKPHVQDKGHYSHLRLNMTDKSYEITPIINEEFFKANKEIGSYYYDFSIDNFVIIKGFSDFSKDVGCRVFIYNMLNKDVFYYTIPLIKNNEMAVLNVFHVKEQEQILLLVKRTKWDAMRINSTDKYELHTVSTTDHTGTFEEFSFENKDFSISEIYSSGNPSATIVSYYLKGKGYAVLDLTTKELKTIPINTTYNEIFFTNYFQLNENEGVFKICLGAGGSAEIYKYIYINGKEEQVTDLGDISVKKHTIPAYMNFLTIFYDHKIIEFGKKSVVIIENGQMELQEDFPVSMFADGFKFIKNGQMIIYSDMSGSVGGTKNKIELDLNTLKHTETPLDKKYKAEGVTSKRYISDESTHYLLYSQTKDGTTFYETIDF